MNQTEQVTSITGADIDTAIQDERVTLLEAAAKAIFSLQRQVIAQNKCIKKLETVATQDAEAIGRLWDNVIAQAKHIDKLEAVLRNWLAVDEEPTAIPLFGLGLTELERRIERLKRDVKLNSGLINCLQNVGLKDNKRIKKLETAPPLYSVAPALYSIAPVPE